ncbi:MAG TPA: DUF11 domain-containing protein, partial [Candidatus Binatia bacterium]|nr:DUF11 domain-containing protein [Candidatus Binatia bacterium]
MKYAAASRGRSQVFWLTVLFLLSLLVQYASFTGPRPVIAAHDEGIFELDGNALDEAAAGDDWEDGTPGAADTFFVGYSAENAASDDTYLQTGNSKDENDIASWVITDTGAPDKNELLNAYAAVYQSGGDTWVYFGADRFDNDGTANIGFWFFQDDIGISGGSFTGGHLPGDVLIVSEYSNGGVVSEICAYVWDPADDGDNVANPGNCDLATNGSNLDLVAAGVACDVADGTFEICARTNAASTDAPWTFLNKDGSTDFGPGQFFEGGINLSDMFGGDAPCFGTFLAETRSSDQTDAQLKDFAFGDFDTCVPPTINTTSSHSTRDFGQQVTDTANLSGSNGPVTGTVDFFICTPTQVTSGGCEGNAGTKVGSTKTIASGTATSDPYTIGLTSAAVGKYCWRAEYTPDDESNYKEGSHTNSTTECFTVAPATIQITKTANPAGPVTVGGEIGFDITVSNTGTGTALDIEVTDELPAGISWTADAPTGNTTGVSCEIDTTADPDELTCTDPSLPGGASWTVHIHGVTDDADCGTVSNSAEVTTSNDGSDEDDAEVLVACPALDIVKTDNDATYDEVGDVITYEITVTNIGNVTLTSVVVSDPNAPNIDCSADPGQQTTIPSLAPGASVVCSASHTVTQEDLDNGEYLNTACADDGEGGAEEVCDDEDTPGEQNPALNVVKLATSVDGDDTPPFLVDEAGDVITYSITVTNTGNVTLHNVFIDDPLLSDEDCDPAPGLQTSGFTLAPGESLTCTGTYTVTQADIDDNGDGDGDIDNT